MKSRLALYEKVQKCGRLKIRGFVAKTGERGKNLVRHAANRVDVRSCNTELVGLYWQIGQYISGKLAAAVWGDGVVDRLAQHLAHAMSGQRGFTRRNLFRMRQFFEAYNGDEKVTPLVTQLPWTHN
jgi:hypothetical protein